MSSANVTNVTPTNTKARRAKSIASVKIRSYTRSRSYKKRNLNMSNVNFNKKPDKEPQSGTCAEVHQAHSVDKDVTKFQAEATRRMKKNPADADLH